MPMSWLGVTFSFLAHLSFIVGQDAHPLPLAFRIAVKKPVVDVFDNGSAEGFLQETKPELQIRAMYLLEKYKLQHSFDLISLCTSRIEVHKDQFFGLLSLTLQRDILLASVQANVKRSVGYLRNDNLSSNVMTDE
ncbi:hypothetical protein HDU86_001565 [Geranomyces michiganensis]|nr:hypothetical protein HDU86_001565 [Geranomyces michiganensis]